ncbi:4-hydroxythreonine-4-phosphate dehydrogenase PdxA [Microbacterium sp. gxy059]|uniref:4-hydroxythreonine-4-phosphate dehydrogenase PdxA n=1 Tax=Microbacterium sp. gxy059 TaxID=2957199 RepID=UPI003D99EBE0
MTNRPRIALTLGDPAGIGPELAAKLMSRPENRRAARILLLADRSELEAAAAQAQVDVPPIGADLEDGIVLLDDGSAPTEPIELGVVSEAAGARVKHQLLRALALVNEGEADAIVFAPLNKTSLHLAGMNHEDELRWFAEELGYTGTTSELNILDGLWTARVTSHVGIQDVAALVTQERVVAAIELLHGVLRDSGLASPRLGVAALNPHNGENGLFGRQEIEVIRPGVEEAKDSGIDVDGPLPADTIFLQRDRFDGIVTMYHDQGQIAMKLLGFEGGVTVQGGLPVVIATPAHGTAFGIVGENVADLTSTQNAFDVAVAVASSRASGS